MSQSTTLITGISGFIARHCALELLRAGYPVRGTVRSMAKAESVRASLARHTDVSALEFAEADLSSDAGWQAAMKGCDNVLHVASPFPAGQPKDEQVLIRPAVEGTLRVLGLLSLNASPESTTLLGFEEPENGVHPRRIRLMAELLRSRSATAETQLIVTTHSPLLIDMLPEESLYLCRKTGTNTEILPFLSFGDLFRKHEIEDALEERPAVSDRILRGDFDA